MPIRRIFLQQNVGRYPEVEPPKILSFIEWDPECQRELLNFCNKIGPAGEQTCIFGDIASFFRDELQPLVQDLIRKPGMALEILSPLICQRKAMKRKAKCLRHGKECYLQTASEHFAGSSCTAHSKQGKGLAFADKNAIHFMAWAGLRLEIQEREVNLENVCEFDTAVLDRLLGSAYFIEAVVLDPRAYGCFG